MKKLILNVIIIIFTTFNLLADSTKNQIISKAKETTLTADSLFDAGRGKEAIIIMEDFLNYFYSLPEDIQKEMQYIPAWRNYYLSQYYAGENNKEKSLECFCNAMELGLVNDKNAYQGAKNDRIFDIISNEPQFRKYYEIMDNKFSFRAILKKCGEYTHDSIDLCFKYESPNSANLIKLRKYFHLDSVAGDGDELSKIKNLLHFVHNLIRHDGSSEWSVKHPESTIEFVELCKQHNIGANCRKLAILLNECYLSMGLKSRYITCIPKTYISDCHVINSVWSNQLGKWIWVDPTYDAFVMDENNNLLGISEVREYIIAGKFLKINDYANWNHTYDVPKEFYIDYYMAKNLYFIQACIYYGANMETNNTHPIEYITLAPTGFDTDPEVKLYRTDNNRYITSDTSFWKNPK